MKSTIRFNTACESGFVSVPKSVSAKFPSEDKVSIEGIVGSFPFQATLESDGKDGHRFNIGKVMPDSVPVEITRIGDEVETRVPKDLQTALASDAKALALWTDITPLARRDWIFWIISAKQLKTRASRIQQACDKLASGQRRVCCFPGIAWLKKNG